ncbi:MAG TPA: Na+/H+ antiporter NhaA [Desulfobulbus sp.]|nr:Na+/H+ antiporter NhaA [Desulfobulbus sp.]
MTYAQRKDLFTRFLHSQTSSSLVLIMATMTAVVWANSPWADLYRTLSHLEIGTHFAGRTYQLSLDHWVKDGLMAVFFFVVGLEIKREVLIGELSSLKQAILPVMAAVGGAVVPALIYHGFNPAGPAANGWGVPMATDIAFALGVLALLGKRVPIGLKVFLTALAIVDDLLAVLVIALFYTEQISIPALVLGFAFLALLTWTLRAFRHQASMNILLMFVIWVCIFLSGIHATIAGVLIAMTIPIRGHLEPQQFFDLLCEHTQLLRESELTRESMINEKWQRNAIEKIYLAAQDIMPIGVYLEDNLHTVQAFLILPLFALFSAGVTVDKAMIDAFPSTVSYGIILGLVLGKQLGIFSFAFLAIKSGLANMPTGVNWGQLWGAAALGGIGFTMSIFISELGFRDQAAILADAKIAIFLASVLAALCGYLILHFMLPRKQKT